MSPVFPPVTTMREVAALREAAQARKDQELIDHLGEQSLRRSLAEARAIHHKLCQDVRDASALVEEIKMERDRQGLLVDAMRQVVDALDKLRALSKGREERERG